MTHRTALPAAAESGTIDGGRDQQLKLSDPPVCPVRGVSARRGAAVPAGLRRAEAAASLCGCCASAAHPHPPPLPGQRRVAYALLRRCGSSARLRSAAPAPSFFPGFLGLRLPHSCTADHSCWFCLLLVGPAPIRTVCSSFARLCFPIRCVAGKSSRGPMWVLQECCPTHTRRRSRPGPVPPLPRSSAASACGPALPGRALFACLFCGAVIAPAAEISRTRSARRRG